MTITQPSVFTAPDDEAVLLRVDDGYVDNEGLYEMLGLSRMVAPAGPQGECAFFLLYLTTVHYDTDVSVWVTPIVDGTALPTTRIDLTGVIDSQGERQTHEVSLLIPLLDSLGVEQLRYAKRGTWIGVQVETKYGDAEDGAAPAAADQIVEQCDVEFEVVREQKQAVNSG